MGVLFVCSGVWLASGGFVRIIVMYVCRRLVFGKCRQPCSEYFFITSYEQNRIE